jgi:hypothetical protein
MILPMSDGLLRIPQRNLDRLHLTHLVSGLDDDSGSQARSCGSSIAISGYTEWISAEEPRLSLGWDWQLEGTASTPRARRLGLPRTNVLLLDHDRAALPWNENLHVLASFIDGFNWNTPAFRAVCERYAA